MSKCSGCMTQCQECLNKESEALVLDLVEFGSCFTIGGRRVPPEDVTITQGEIDNEANSKLEDTLNSLLHLNNEYVKIIANKEGVFALLEDNSIFCIYEYERNEK